ncbi:MAG: (Fe-S)-binding protein [Dehalococcoidales bacterium]|nr:(Fe-S)-binding protein [Dehalococcoidales bacterium]
MVIEDYRNDMETCRRCSACKFIPLERVRGYDRINVCPSISRYEYHTYSGGGRMVFGTSMLTDRLDYTDKLLEVIYNCQMCGACDVSCKYSMDMEVQDSLNEIRIKCVDDGHAPPVLKGLVDNIKKNGSMVSGVKAGRGEWVEDMTIKDIRREKTGVLYFAGCRTCFDRDMWKIAQANVRLLQKAGVDVGIAGAGESCCGGRAFRMGFRQEFLDQAKRNMEMIRKAGIKTLVTGCAECYQAFKVLYDRFNLKGDLEVVHTTECFDRLIAEGRLKPSRQVKARVTYHDPCNLGRQGEGWIHWQGKVIPGHMRLFDPPKQFRRGASGTYEPPRRVLKSIPGITLAEMQRIREYSWCCGSGGGVKENNPEYAAWTAGERLEEARDTAAGILVTACPGCLKNFRDALKGSSLKIEVCDVVELLEKSIK